MSTITTRILGIGAAALIACAGLASPALAQASEQQESAKQEQKLLKVGDPAPKLQVAKFVKGKPIEQFEKGQVYVVEFWATWCGPCKVSIPHLTEVQHEYKDKNVKVIGVSIWEQGEALSTVEKFVANMGDKMDYTVAYDGDRGDGYMAENWMAAAKRNGIPSAFIVDKQGKIAWIGHPMDGMDDVLAKVVDGTWDPSKHANFEQNARKTYAEMMQAREAGDWENAVKHAEDLIALNPKMFNQVAVMRFEMMLVEMKDYERAYGYAQELSKKYADDAMVQNAVAWTIVDSEGVKDRNLDLAAKMADRANELTDNSDPAILDTVARVEFEKGNVDKAIQIQKKAVKLAEGNLKPQLQAALDRYEAASKK